MVTNYMLYVALLVSLQISNWQKQAVHDIHYLKNIKDNFSSCVIIGDKGYLSADYQLDLFTSNQIKLEVPMRINQNEYKKQPYLFRKTKKKNWNIIFSTLGPIYDSEETTLSLSTDINKNIVKNNILNSYSVDKQIIKQKY